MTVTITPDSLGNLLTSPQAIGGLGETLMDDGDLYVRVLNQAYTDGAGLYAYLYQVDNNLDQSEAFVEVFTLAPWTGAAADIQMGYLTGTLPAGFMSGGQAPWDTANANISVGPTLSFYYLDAFDKAMYAGEHSVVMYVLSELSPDVIIGNVINGSVASGSVVGPLVPEPTTVALLGLGAVVLLRKRRTS